MVGLWGGESGRVEGNLQGFRPLHLEDRGAIQGAKYRGGGIGGRGKLGEQEEMVSLVWKVLSLRYL